MDPKTQVASGFTVARYNAIRATLDPTRVESENWREVLRAFERRMRERYWEPIRKLEVDDALPALTLRPGFAIVALCCLLIETMNSFENGGPLPSHGPSKRKFIEYLTERLRFGDADAESFYSNVRNKLLHDGETQKDWKIRRGSGRPVVDQEGEVHVLNRVPFRAELERQFASYCNRLRSQPAADLRLKFRNRFDILCNSGDGE